MDKTFWKPRWNRLSSFLKDVFFLIVTFILFIVSFLSCAIDEEIVSYDPNFQLYFSSDTILFDTIFTSVGSVTKRLKIYNKNKNAVNIKNISLAGSSSSSYNINILGEQSFEFKDVYLRGGDSLLILVTVKINPQNKNLPFLVKDSIIFSGNSEPQDIKLVAYGQDAIFLENIVLPCNTIWTSERPYVIRNKILVDSACELTIEKGAKIFFSNKAALYIKGSLKALGDKENIISFRNDRLDGEYKNAPGQWDGLFFLKGSTNNVIKYANIRNAVSGVILETLNSDSIPDLLLSNSIIENMSFAGLISYNSHVTAENVLINNCGSYTVGNFGGGNYSYKHCTFANFNFTFVRNSPSVILSDYIILDDNALYQNDIKIELHNNIIWGTLKEEVIIAVSGSTFHLNTSNNIIRTSLLELDVNNNMLNTTDLNFPKFINPEKYNYQLDTLSPAKDSATPSLLAIDLLGNVRDNLPDIGAYERLE